MGEDGEMPCRQGKEESPGLQREYDLTITPPYQLRHALNLAAAHFTALLRSLSLTYLLTTAILGSSFVSWLVYGRTSWMLQSLRALLLQLKAAASVQPVCWAEVAHLLLTSHGWMNSFQP